MYPMNRINLIGQKFGRLLVIACEGYFNGQSRWRCQCECGEIKINGSSNLRQGRVKSCGCFNREFKAAGGPNKRHGMFGTPTYNTWGGMKGRCYNPKNHKFPDYGGRGITVCDRWLTSFENFFADMGLKPQGKTIDRMENNGNYEPSNCRWATPIQQVHNRRPTSTHFRCAVNGFYGTLPEI